MLSDAARGTKTSMPLLDNLRHGDGGSGTGSARASLNASWDSISFKAFLLLLLFIYESKESIKTRTIAAAFASAFHFLTAFAAVSPTMFNISLFSTIFSTVSAKFSIESSISVTKISPLSSRSKSVAPI